MNVYSITCHRNTQKLSLGSCDIFPKELNLNFNNMSKRLTLEEFIKRAEEIHGKGRYDFTNTNYVNNRTSVLVKCNLCGKELSIYPSSFLINKNSGCDCQPKEKSPVHDLESFIEEAEKLYGKDKYDFSNSKYLGMKKPIKIFCNNCKSYFWKTPYNFLHGSECSCYRKITTETFIERAEDIYGVGRYGYQESVYVNNKTPIKIFCPECNKYFYKTPHAFIDGKLGCRDCSLKEKSNNQKLTTEEFIKRAVKIHGNLYDYSESNYIDTKTPVKIKDNETGDIFWQKPESHLHGYGNPKRSDSFGEKIIRQCLEKLNIDYRKEYFVKDKIKGRNSNIVRIDFQCNINNQEIWIEYNGKQHYMFEEAFWKRVTNGKSLEIQHLEYRKQLERDKQVKEYCKENNILIIEIPYTYRTFSKLLDVLSDILINHKSPEDIITYPEIIPLDNKT